MDGYIEFAVCLAAEDAVGGWNIGVIPADSGTNVAMMGDEVVGRIEADPSEMGHQDVDPGMGCIGVERSWSSLLR